MVAGWASLSGRRARHGSGVVLGPAFQLVFGTGGVEHQWRTPDSGREAGELHLAVNIGAGFEVEFVESAETIGDMNFDGGRSRGLAVGSGDSQVNRAAAEGTVDGRYRLSRLRRNGGNEAACHQEENAWCDGFLGHPRHAIIAGWIGDPVPLRMQKGPIAGMVTSSFL